VVLNGGARPRFLYTAFGADFSPPDSAAYFNSVRRAVSRYLAKEHPMTRLQFTFYSLLAAAVLTALSAPPLCGISIADEPALEEGYDSLFNGKDLSGWEYGAVPPVKNPPPREKLEGQAETSDGVFAVVDGHLVASGKKIKALYTRREFNGDFQLKFEFRAAADKPKDNSGLFLRGKQLQLDATNQPGSLTGTFRNVKNFKLGDWNEIDVVVTGQEAVCRCNGELITKNPLQLPATGTIGLQSEYGAFQFRRLRIKAAE
jgi:hypothetical protein